MSTTTQELAVQAPPDTEVVEVVETKTTKKQKKAIRKDLAWYEKALKRAKKAAKKSRRGMRKAMGWMKAKATKAYKAAMKAVRSSRRKVVALTKAAASGVASMSADAWSWTAAKTGWMWGNLTDGLYWASTPVRIAFGTLFGMTFLQVFGPTLLIVSALGLLTFLLLSDPTSRRKVVVVRQKTTQDDSNSLETTLMYNAFQKKALEDRLVQLESQEPRSPSEVSNLMGRRHMVTERLRGNTSPVNSMYASYRAALEAQLADQPAKLKDISWNSLRSGMRSEHSMVRKLMEINVDKTGQLATAQLANANGS